MRDEETKKLSVHLVFNFELFVKPEDGQAILLFFLEEGDNWDLKSFIDLFKERIGKDFNKIDSKKKIDKS